MDNKNNFVLNYLGIKYSHSISDFYSKYRNHATIIVNADVYFCSNWLFY